MASGSDVPRSAGTEVSWSFENLNEVADLFGGEVHLACAREPSSDGVVVAAGFTAEAALARAEARASAMDVLRRIPHSASPGPGVTGIRGKVLDLADFVADQPAGADVTYVTGEGMLSQDRYLVPADVVGLGEGDNLAEPTLLGLAGDHRHATSRALAEVLAHDAFARWWDRPRDSLFRVSAHLSRLLTPGIEAGLSAVGLWVTAFVLPDPELRIVVVGISGEGTTIAPAAGSSVTSAAREAFLRAVEARVQPWVTLPVADSLRRMTVWHRESDYVTLLERAAVDRDPFLIEEGSSWGVSGWADVAARRFGHEPVFVTPGTASHPIKVVCPGAGCYRSARTGTTLPCPAA